MIKLYLAKLCVSGKRILCTWLIIASSPLIAQTLDFGNLKGAPPIKLSGGLNINNLYNSYVPVATQKNAYFINGTLNFNILGVIDVPLNLNFSNRKFSYSQPFNFNQISITPRYKWATGYFGTTSMVFSPYTVNGHQFAGGGVELMPNKWQISVLSGRLIKRTSDTTFNRMGYGAKVVYNPGKFSIGGSVFQAADRLPTLPAGMSLAGLGSRPAKNLVVSLQGGLNLEKIAQLTFEAARSHTSRYYASDSSNAGYQNSGLAKTFFNGYGPVDAKNAFKTTISRPFFGGKTVLGLGYERVDPGYRTFGGYAFTDDFVNYTVNASQRLWQDKINIVGSIGRQQDILATKSNGQSRLVGSANVSVNPTDRLSANFTFSNFKAVTFIRNLVKEISRESGLIPIDTLNFTQINRNIGLNTSYTLVQKESQQHSISFSGSVMDAANKQGNLIRKGQASQVYNVQTTYNVALTDQKLIVGLGYNYNLNTIGVQNVTVMGPSLTAQKEMFKEKLSTMLVVNALSSVSRSGVGTDKSQVLNANATVAYKVTKQSALTVNGLLLKNKASAAPGPDAAPGAVLLPATIYTINVGYNLRF